MTNEDKTDLATRAPNEGVGVGSPLMEVLAGALSAIPYAGGPLATVVQHFHGKAREERILKVIRVLEERVREQGVKIEDFLTREQVAELVSQSLREVSNASDQDKIDALTGGLLSSLTENERTFEEKQFFTTLISRLTSIELRLLTAVYTMSDPYTITIGSGPHEAVRQEPRSGPNMRTAVTGASSGSTLHTYGVRHGWCTSCDVPELMKMLADRLDVSPMLARGAAASLDQLGLTQILAHASERHCGVWGTQDQALVSTATMGSTDPRVQAALSGEQHWVQTPLAAAKTTLGGALIEFVSL